MSGQGPPPPPPRTEKYEREQKSHENLQLSCHAMLLSFYYAVFGNATPDTHLRHSIAGQGHRSASGVESLLQRTLATF